MTAPVWPDPVFGIRVVTFRVVDREVHLLLSDGRRLAYPVDDHPAFVGVPTDRLRHLAVWSDCVAPTLALDLPDTLPLALILRSPAARALEGSAPENLP